ncbi:hypothetical protein Cpir12675_000603 [Ceratocystis pirilliformis]|uniref:Uncharacterized protein n=1 Tax=Ceratocystis pirilliformis TaxID=259994 RepID=A0ABR3ZLV7_9PEZI
MRFFSISLPLALSLVSLSQATILENKGYRKVSAGGVDGVLFRDPYGSYQLADAISFHPWMKMATIYIANNDMEPEHQNKLSLTEIYTALAEEHKRKPEDVDWIVTEVVGDPEMEDFILGIRKGRNVGPKDEVIITPSQHEWKKILDTKHYMYAALVNRKAIDKIIITTHQRTQPGVTFDVSSFHFYFPSWQLRNPYSNDIGSGVATQSDDNLKWAEVWKKEWKAMWKVDMTGGWKAQWSNQAEEAAMYKAIYDAEKQQEASSLAGLATQITQVMSS